MKQRDTYVDVAKGICILLVICIHAEVFGVIGMPFTFIAVPMFFFLSGFYDKSEKPIGVWLPKAMRTLIFPGLFWLAAGIAYAQMLSYAKDGTIEFSNTLYEPFYGNGPVWFLFALFYAKLFTWAILKLKINKPLAIFTAVSGGYWVLNTKCRYALTREWPHCQSTI